LQEHWREMVHIDLIPSEMRLYVLLAGILVPWCGIFSHGTGTTDLKLTCSYRRYAGAAIMAHQGFEGLLKPEGWIKTILFIVASPSWYASRFTFMVVVYWIFRKWSPARVDKTFRRGQLFSAALFSLGHGVTMLRKRWESLQQCS